MQTLSSNEKKLVGYTVTASVNEDIEAGLVEKLREKLSKTRNQITNQLSDSDMYLVQLYPDSEWTPDVPFTSIIAVEVSGFSDVPEEFIQHTIPAGAYVKVTHRGPESKLTETYDFIQKKSINNNRSFDFEHWTIIHSLNQEESTIDIYLPVES
jgi:predicted transcriptional regulator YdeE